MNGRRFPFFSPKGWESSDRGIAPGADEDGTATFARSNTPV